MEIHEEIEQVDVKKEEELFFKLLNESKLTNTNSNLISSIKVYNGEDGDFLRVVNGYTKSSIVPYGAFVEIKFMEKYNVTVDTIALLKPECNVFYKNDDFSDKPFLNETQYLTNTKKESFTEIMTLHIFYNSSITIHINKEKTYRYFFNVFNPIIINNDNEDIYIYK